MDSGLLRQNRPKSIGIQRLVQQRGDSKAFHHLVIQGVVVAGAQDAAQIIADFLEGIAPSRLRLLIAAIEGA